VVERDGKTQKKAPLALEQRPGDRDELPNDDLRHLTPARADTLQLLLNYYCSSQRLPDPDLEESEFIETPRQIAPLREAGIQTLRATLGNLTTQEHRFLRLVYEYGSSVTQAADATNLTNERAEQVQRTVRRALAHALADFDENSTRFNEFVEALQSGEEHGIELLEPYAVGPAFMSLVFSSPGDDVALFRQRCFWTTDERLPPCPPFERMGERTKVAYMSYLVQKYGDLSRIPASPLLFWMFGLENQFPELEKEIPVALRELQQRLVAAGVFSGSLVEKIAASPDSARWPFPGHYVDAQIVGKKLLKENLLIIRCQVVEALLAGPAQSSEASRLARESVLENLRNNPSLSSELEVVLNHYPLVRTLIAGELRKELPALLLISPEKLEPLACLILFDDPKILSRYLADGRPTFKSFFLTLCGERGRHTILSSLGIPSSQAGMKSVHELSIEDARGIGIRGLALLRHSWPIPDAILGAALERPKDFEILASNKYPSVVQLRSRIFNAQGGFHIERLGDKTLQAFASFMQSRHPEIDKIKPSMALGQILGLKKGDLNDNTGTPLGNFPDKRAWRIAKACIDIGVYSAKAKPDYALARRSELGFLLMRRVVGDAQFEENRYTVLSALFPTLDHAHAREGSATVTKAVKSILDLPPSSSVFKVCARLVDLGITHPLIPPNHSFPARHMSNYFEPEAVGFFHFYNLGEHIRDVYKTIDGLFQVGATLGSPLGVGNRTFDIVKETLSRGYLTAEAPEGQAPGASNSGSTSTLFYDEETVGKERVKLNLRFYLEFTLKHLGELKNETKGARVLRKLCNRYFGTTSYLDIAAYSVREGLKSPGLPLDYNPKTDQDMYFQPRVVGSVLAAAHLLEWNRRRAS